MMMIKILSLVRVMMMTLAATSSSSYLLAVSLVVFSWMTIVIRNGRSDTIPVTELLVLVVVLPAGHHQTVHGPAPVHLHLQHSVKLPIHANLGVGEHAEHDGDGQQDGHDVCIQSGS